LSTELVSVLETFINSPEAFVVLTDGYVPLDLIDHILIANKQLSSLEDERAKAIRGD
jgi:protein involved in polysaccharide export with SLBB domain